MIRSKATFIIAKIRMKLLSIYQDGELHIPHITSFVESILPINIYFHTLML